MQQQEYEDLLTARTGRKSLESLHVIDGGTFESRRIYNMSY